MTCIFELQGHRGARGLKPENTLPSFEVAFDLDVSSVETDVHLTSDCIPVLFHDPRISPSLCSRLPGGAAPDPAKLSLIRELSLAELRGYAANQNPDPIRFPAQDRDVTPLARWFAGERGIDPYTPPALSDLFAFACAYAGQPGADCGKSDSQRAGARRMRFDLELKRVPFHPVQIGDEFDGSSPALFEKSVVEAVRAAGMVERTTVRSFDHRSVWLVGKLEPGLTTAVLVDGTAPVCPVSLARQANARVYCPSFDFLDLAQVRNLHAEGIRVLPWTVNDPADWKRLLEWGVDGITTDYPDRLVAELRARKIEW